MWPPDRTGLVPHTSQPWMCLSFDEDTVFARPSSFSRLGWDICKYLFVLIFFSNLIVFFPLLIQSKWDKLVINFFRVEMNPHVEY